MGHKDFRITSKVQNNLLLRAIEAKGFETVGGFCGAHKLLSGAVGDLVNFKSSPFGKRSGTWIPLVIKLSEILQILPEELFAEAHWTAISSNKVVQEVSQAEVEFLLDNVEQQDAHKLIENQERDKLLYTALHTLPLREERIVRLRHGLDGEEEKMFKEIAEILDITMVNANLLYNKALRKLMHPKRTAELRAYLKEE